MGLPFLNVREMLCKLGYHKYDLRKMTTMYLGEVNGSVYEYNVQNECIHCGHHFCENIYIPMPVWSNRNVAIWAKDYAYSPDPEDIHDPRDEKREELKKQNG